MKSIPSLRVERIKIRHRDFDATLRIRMCHEIYGGFWWSTCNLTRQHLHDVVAVSQEGGRRSYWTVKGLCPCSRRSMATHWLKTRTIAWQPGNSEVHRGREASSSIQHPYFQNSTYSPLSFYILETVTYHTPSRLCSVQPYTSTGLMQLSETAEIKKDEGFLKKGRSKVGTFQGPAIYLFPTRWSGSCSKQIASSTAEISLCCNDIKQAKQLQTSVPAWARPVWVS